MTAIRTAWGASLLIAPDAALCNADPQRGTRALARVLGARQLIQSAIVASRPTRRTILVSVAVDTTHLATVLAVLAFRPDLRRPALINTLSATIFVVLGIRQAQHVTRAGRPTVRSTGGRSVER